MKAKEIFLLVSQKLQDLGAGTTKRWQWEIDNTGAKASLVDFCNNALRQIALNRPDATAITETILLQPGVRQLIPSPALHRSSKKALSLIELVRNMGSDGDTPGEPIFIASRDAMSAYNWGVSGLSVDNYAYDFKVNPQVYLVYPGVSDSEDVFVEATYSAEPTQIFSAYEEIPIPQTFSGPIMHWMLYEIFSGDNSSSNTAKAQHHMTAFYQALGVKLKADLFFPVQINQQQA